ncbi:dynactin p62 subunit [Holotrichia oblita]|uniref:Dynactin p62 subunit n=1 Tax=Holotrichia oblita TaxID=644536 RepID=A0ACB9T0P8_HOLOL|nr:dynactin p62 subunit [Holotrichia oblita]
MAYIVEREVVKYVCTCGLLKPISKLYFCRYCLEVRCGFCVCHEVDSHFCEKCLENMPSAEARLKKNRCGNCLICPSCLLHLSVRAATIGPKNPEDPKATPRKVVYLHCLMCRWSSRDVGIPDQIAATGGWPERENVYNVRLTEIIEWYKSVVLLEKQQKLEKDKKKQRKYMSFTDKTGLTAEMIRKRIGLTEPPNPLLKAKAKPLEGAVAKEEVEELPDNIFTQPIKLNEITTIQQRLLQPEWQPVSVDKLFPIHKHLSVKQSLRCRSCEHNVSKPEFNPNSVRFKIQLFAYYHIPEIRIVTVEPLRAGQPAELLLKFINPTQHQTVVTIMDLSSMPEILQDDKSSADISTEDELKPIEKEPLSLSLTQSASLLHTTLSRQPSFTIKPRQIKQQVGADIEIPAANFVLPPRDDAAEFDDSGENYNFNDDPRLVKWRKSNKAVIKLQITPSASLNLGDEVVVGFVMQHIYTNTIATSVEKDKEPQKCQHKIRVFLSLGNLVGSSE